MTTYLIPMFLVVTADTLDAAEDVACRAQVVVRSGTHGFLYQDESLATKVIPSEDEPHTILDYYTQEELR